MLYRPFSAWPLTVKVPVVVVALMVAVATIISQVVLSRFQRNQEANLSLLTSAYLDGLSAAVLPAVLRSEPWDAFDALERTREQYAGVVARYTIIEMPNGGVLAASDSERFPVHSSVPEELLRRFASGDDLAIDEVTGRAWLSRTLKEGGIAVGRILAEIDIADLLRVRRGVLLTLVGVNGALTAAFALIGYFAVRRMVQPLGLLSRYVERVRDGKLELVPERYRQGLASEFSRLFERFNEMARTLGERETLASYLAEQEKYAMLGRLASGMAHEVNNPLGGMMNAIDTIQAHGDDPEVLRKSLEFLKRGLAGIRNVARAALVTYKGGDTGVLTATDFDDLPFLVQHETGVRRIRLDWCNRIAEPLRPQIIAGRGGKRRGATRQDQGGGLGLGRADGTEDVGRAGALVARGGWPRAAARPSAGDLVLLPDLGLVLEPELNGLAGSLARRNLRQDGGEVF